MTANPGPNSRPDDQPRRDPEAVIASARRNKTLVQGLDEALEQLERGDLGTPLRDVLRERRTS